jgi:hypothetical protein
MTSWLGKQMSKWEIKSCHLTNYCKIKLTATPGIGHFLKKKKVVCLYGLTITTIMGKFDQGPAVDLWLAFDVTRACAVKLKSKQLYSNYIGFQWPWKWHSWFFFFGGGAIHKFQSHLWGEIVNYYPWSNLPWMATEWCVWRPKCLKDCRIFHTKVLMKTHFSYMWYTKPKRQSVWFIFISKVPE